MKQENNKPQSFSEAMGLTDADMHMIINEVAKITDDRNITRSEAVDQICKFTSGMPEAFRYYMLVMFGNYVGHDEGHACERRQRKLRVQLKKTLRALGLDIKGAKMKIVPPDAEAIQKIKDEHFRKQNGIDPNMN